MNVGRLYSDNGFTSFDAMEQSHARLVSYVAARDLGHVRRILDLGCGNGLLLKKLATRHPGADIYGIDLQPDRIDLARVLNPDAPRRFRTGSLFDAGRLFPETRFDLTLLMLGRLLDAPETHVRPLTTFLSERGGCVLGYVYADWMSRKHDVPAIAHALGLQITALTPERDIALVSFAKNHTNNVL